MPYAHNFEVQSPPPPWALLFHMSSSNAEPICTDQEIQENFKLKLNAKEIDFVSGKIKRNYKIISKRNKPNGSMILVSHYINKDYYGGYMFTLSINYESKEYLYSSAMMGAGEILEGPVGSRGSCKKIK